VLKMKKAGIVVRLTTEQQEMDREEEEEEEQHQPSQNVECSMTMELLVAVVEEVRVRN